MLEVEDVVPRDPLFAYWEVDLSLVAAGSVYLGTQHLANLDGGQAEAAAGVKDLVVHVWGICESRYRKALKTSSACFVL